jgi:hypothetical protein
LHPIKETASNKPAPTGKLHPQRFRTPAILPFQLFFASRFSGEDSEPGHNVLDAPRIPLPLVLIISSDRSNTDFD